MTDGTMLMKIKHHSVIKFLIKQEKFQKINDVEMVAVYQDSTSVLSTIQKCSSKFKGDRESIKDNPQSGEPPQKKM